MHDDNKSQKLLYGRFYYVSYRFYRVLYSFAASSVWTFYSTGWQANNTVITCKVFAAGETMVMSFVLHDFLGI